MKNSEYIFIKSKGAYISTIDDEELDETEEVESVKDQLLKSK